MTSPISVRFPVPVMQSGFARQLDLMRHQCLQAALLQTLRSIDITQVDLELGQYAPLVDLGTMASAGLRGELVFPVPTVLDANPRLVAYYRLLLGYSQKTFYSHDCGATAFKPMETHGIVPRQTASRLPSLCSALCIAASQLLESLDSTSLTHLLLHELSLLTVGAQLRGGANNVLGTVAIDAVFGVIRDVVSSAIVSSSQKSLELVSAAGRKVIIELAADPDIVIRESMADNQLRHVVAIEIKGGTDVSNIHNRIGEAEKSHQKARLAGYTEFWTVVNVGHFDRHKAHEESPTTNRFYSLAALTLRSGAEFDDFAMRVRSLAGVF